MTVEPQHLRLDVSLAVSRAQAEHEAHCPDIGPICAVRAEPPQEHHTTLWLTELRALAEYGVFRRLAVQAVVPFRIVDARTRYSDLAGHFKTLDYENIHHADGALFGIGDPQLLAHSGFSLGDFQISGRAGFSVPLGQVTEDPYRLGEEGKPHQHIQFGTGSVDPLLGVDATWLFRRWSASAFGFARTPLYPGRNGYQAGSQLSAGVAVSAPVGATEARLRISALVAHELAEKWSGALPVEDGNLGRTDLFIGFGITVPFAGDWSASVDLSTRAWGQAAGAQLDLPVVLQLSIGRLLHLESTSHEEAVGSGIDVVDAVSNGEAAALEPVPGKWTVFDFWAPWCEACKGLDARLRQLVTERPDVALRRINIVDFESPIARRELPGVEVLPHVRLVDPEGKTVFEQSGTADALFDVVQRLASTHFVCPMHPEVVADHAGSCPVCGMKLEVKR